MQDGVVGQGRGVETEEDFRMVVVSGDADDSVGRYSRSASNVSTQRRWTIGAAVVCCLVVVAVSLAVISPRHRGLSPANDADGGTDGSGSGDDAREISAWLDDPSNIGVFDGHNDLPWELRVNFASRVSEAQKLPSGDGGPDLNAESVPGLMTSIPRMSEGGYGAQFWSVYVPCGDGKNHVAETFQQIDLVRRMVDAYPTKLALATNVAEIKRARDAGKVASLIGVEGGHSMNSSFAVLRQLHAAGARYMTLTHTCNTPWADSSVGPPAVGGLSPLGVQIVKEMNRIGIAVDLSHVSADAMRAALVATTAPVMFSHSSAFALCGHARNVPDDVIRSVAENGGVIAVNFYPPFVSCPPGSPDSGKATIRDVAAHIVHIASVGGIASVGLGSDFDGIGSTPEGLSSPADVKALLEILRREHDFSDDDVLAISGRNALRVFAGVEAESKRLRDLNTPAAVDDTQ